MTPKRTNRNRSDILKSEVTRPDCPELSGNKRWAPLKGGLARRKA